MARGAANDPQWTTRLPDRRAARRRLSRRHRRQRPPLWRARRIYQPRLARRQGGDAGSAASADAARMFDRYGRAARSPQTRAKGFYWAAAPPRPPARRSNPTAWLEQARRAPTSFTASSRSSGSAARRPSPAADAADQRRRALAPSPPGRWSRRRAARHDRHRWATRPCSSAPSPSRPRPTATAPSPPSSAGTIGRLGHRRLGGARGAHQGRQLLRPRGFPEVPIPPAYSRHWALAHGITRQESSFDRAAVSHAGARGLMQLMPGTAREAAGRLGLPYDFGRLTADPAYNIMLGIHHLSRADRPMGRQRRRWSPRPTMPAAATSAAGSRESATRACPAPTSSPGSRRSPSPRPATTCSGCSRMRSSTTHRSEPAGRPGAQPALLLSRQARVGLNAASSTRVSDRPNYITPAGYRRCARNMRRLFGGRAAEAGRDDRLGGGQWRPLREWRLSIRPQAAARDRPAARLAVAADEGRQGRRSGRASRSAAGSGSAPPSPSPTRTTTGASSPWSARTRPTPAPAGSAGTRRWPRDPRRRGRRPAPGRPARRRARR